MKTINLLLVLALLLSYCSLNANGFAKGTLITMSDLTTRNIENLQIGDTVLAINLENKSIENIIVESVAKVNVKKSVLLQLVDGSQLEMSEKNLLLSNTGWLTFNENIIIDNPSLQIKEASINDFIVCINTNNAIQSSLIDTFSYQDKDDDYYHISFKTTNREYAFIVNNMFTSCFFDFFK